MTTYSVILMDARVNSNDADIAESAFRASLEAQCPNIDLLKKIYDDYIAGINGAVEHFENAQSAWDLIQNEATNAAFEKLGFWPKDSAHFEINFN